MTARCVLVPLEGTPEMVEAFGESRFVWAALADVVKEGERTNIRIDLKAALAAAPYAGRVPYEIAFGMMNAMWNIGQGYPNASTVEEVFMRFLGLEVLPEGQLEIEEEKG